MSSKIKREKEREIGERIGGLGGGGDGERVLTEIGRGLERERKRKREIDRVIDT